jgi:DnaJ-class molecular chaperone
MNAEVSRAISMTYLERKAQRTEHYLRFSHGWKTRPCTACNGSGHYDNGGSPACASCEGTGKERYNPVTNSTYAVPTSDPLVVSALC